MLSVVAHAARDLRVEDMDAPPAPGPGEVAVDMRVGGICGSDLHYFNHGGVGANRLKEPMVLGHEAAGVIAAVGPGVAGLDVGQTVAVDPSMPCRVCAQCRRGRANLCTDMRFNGSAMRFPHVQGLFRGKVVVPAERAVPVACGPDLAALCEPFAVCLHAAKRAGPLLGARVLVAGSGPIGCLTVLAARLAGASEVVVTDVADAPLRVASSLGADRAINVAGPGGLDGAGGFDVGFECSGNAGALLGAIGALGPGGRLVLVGLGGEVPLPIAAVVPREVEIVGSFRFDDEFALAARLISSGRVDPSPLITHALPLTDALDAFVLAADRGQAMKVQLDLST
ncbi:MAG: L-idonate 5-dehydrogenase [Geminicoccaceae bacterium]|nr:L-idonate 5-dehydrogenase [Geminicoccaceae bacterium]